jgi:hypothetical protein
MPIANLREQDMCARDRRDMNFHSWGVMSNATKKDKQEHMAALGTVKHRLHIVAAPMPIASLREQYMCSRDKRDMYAATVQFD